MPLDKCSRHFKNKGLVQEKSKASSQIFLYLYLYQTPPLLRPFLSNGIAIWVPQTRQRNIFTICWSEHLSIYPFSRETWLRWLWDCWAEWNTNYKWERVGTHGSMDSALTSHPMAPGSFLGFGRTKTLLQFFYLDFKTRFFDDMLPAIANCTGLKMLIEPIKK